jgi:hypothetical protein
MAEQHNEQILIRRISNYGEEPTPIVTPSDLGSNYEIRGVVQLKRVRTAEVQSDSEDKCADYEYVFDVVSVGKFEKQ